MAAIYINQRWAAVIVFLIILAIWALAEPQSFNATVDQAVGVIEGAVNGAKGAV